jgi:hypothetical protein
MFHVACINHMYNFLLGKTTNALGHVNVILLHGNHRHVSVTHVAIFSGENKNAN